MQQPFTASMYAFGEFELDERLYQLRRRGEIVKLEPKVFDVLAYLLHHNDRVVAKDELLAKLWPGEFVSESVLPRCIAAARKALGDDPSEQRIVQTVHGRGYRFVARLDARASPAGGTSAPGAIPFAAESPAATLDAEPKGVFVGRDHAMEQLRAALALAAQGRGRLVLLAGEPGIGKTRTAEELAMHARRQGATVLTARCYEGDGAPAFWPWVQILRSCLRQADPTRMASAMGAGASDIAQLVPELREVVPDLPASPSLSPEQARFRLFESITDFLTGASTARPLLLVVDDLHWADKPSLLLLQFLARAIGASPMLFLGTYRDVALRRHHPLAQTLGDLAREPIHQRILLRGLSEPDVGRLIEVVGGRVPSQTVVTALHEMTEGNPFFLGEIVRLLLAADRAERLSEAGALGVTLPQGVREAIGRRLDGLSAECNEALMIASVIGREFALPILERIANVPGERLLEVLDEAVTARVLDEVARAPGLYSFSHTLIRETLYEEIATPRRVRLHREIGGVLEDAYRSNPGPHLAEIAHHFFQGAPGGDVQPAIDYGKRAAERALALLAYEESAAHYERVLQAIDLRTPVDEADRCDVLLGLGDAQSRSGERESARATFLRAADVARALGRPDQLARAALGFGGRAEFGMPRDETLLALLESALAALRDGEHDALRARVLSRMTGTAPYSESIEKRDALSQQGVELARRVGDPYTLGAALNARYWALLGPDHVADRFALADELVALSQRTDDRSFAWTAHEMRFGALLATGEIAAADRELDVLAVLARELRQPVEQWFVVSFRTSRALADGRFDEAERLIEQALAAGQRAQHPGAIMVANGLALYLAHERGLSEEFSRRFEVFVPHYPWAATLMRVGFALYSTEVGRIDDARQTFEALAANDFRDYQRDEHWTMMMVQLSATCCDLGDERRAAMLYDLLQPFADRNAVHDLLRVSAGSIAHYLGLLAVTMKRWREAARHFEDALAKNTRMGARPFVVRTQYEYARLLFAHGGRDQASRARALVAESAAAAREMGMQRALDNALGLERDAARGVPGARRRSKG